MEEKEIFTRYQKMCEGMINKDRYVLEQVLDESFELTHLTGVKQNREGFISEIEDCTLNYYKIKHFNFDIELKKDYALIIAKSEVLAAVYGGKKNTWKLQQNMKCIKKNKFWVVIESNATSY